MFVGVGSEEFENNDDSALLHHEGPDKAIREDE
jgi:hypothetical protein